MARIPESHWVLEKCVFCLPTKQGLPHPHFRPKERRVTSK